MGPFLVCRCSVFLVFFLFVTMPLAKVGVSANYDVIHQPGDVMLAALFEVSKAGNDVTCGAIDIDAVRAAFALQWFVGEVNKANYIPGVTIGLEIRRLCNSQKRAVREAKYTLDKYTGCDGTSQPPLFGVIGPSTTDSAIKVTQLYAALPEDLRIPLISGSATGTQLNSYANFFRVIPPDDIQVEVIADLLVTLKWNYIAIIYTDEEYGLSAANALKDKAKQKSICVPVFESVPKNTDSQQVNTVVGRLDGVKGAVFIGSKDVAKSFVEKMDIQANSVKIIFSEALGLQTSALKGHSNVLGSLSVTPPYRPVPKFRQAWNDLLRDCSQARGLSWLEGLPLDCNSYKLQEHEKLLFPWYHIQAAAVFAAALQSLHNDMQGNVTKFLEAASNYSRTKLSLHRPEGWDLGDAFSNITSSFVGMNDLVFDGNGTLLAQNSTGAVNYEVHNLTTCSNGDVCFEKVAEYIDGGLHLNETISGRLPVGLAQCSNGKDCVECIPRSLGDFTLVVEGDYYFVAIVPVHFKDKQDAFKCGAARGTLGADFVEAIRFALEEVNKANGLWAGTKKNKKLGAIILDSCYSELVIKHKLLMLHVGQVLTPQGFWHNESYVKDVILKNIVGYVGGFFSDISIAVSQVLTELNSDIMTYVHLSPTSVANELSDRERHPFFMRLTKSANSEVQAILELLKRLSASYVQIIFNEKDQYSTDLLKLFEDNAVRYKVCIAQKIDIAAGSRANPGAYVLRNMRKRLYARVVIPILQFQEINELMAQLLSDEGLEKKDDFVFIGTEAWARKTEIIKDRQKLSGSITIAEEIATIADFDSYFSAADPLNTSDFWLRDYWEEKRNCTLDLSFKRAGRNSHCPGGYKGNYTQDQWIPFYIQAVYALASGVSTAIDAKCVWDKPFSQCDFSSPTLVEKMKGVELDFFGKGKAKVFDDNGDGMNSYKFMQAYWDSSSKSMLYRQIGNWTTGHLMLSYDVSSLTQELPDYIKPRNYETTCPNPVDCAECPELEGEDSSRNSSELPLVPAAATIGAACVLLLIFIIIAIVYIRRYRRSIEYIAKSSCNNTLRFENEGLSSMSSATMSNQPVQEQYYSRSAASEFSFQSQLFQPRPHSEDYATVVEAEAERTPPPPCRVTKAEGYLTATRAGE